MKLIKKMHFSNIWFVDFEFESPKGGHPRPICLVAKDWTTKKTIRLWRDDLRKLKQPPYPTDKKSLFVSYYSPAELGCHLALGWKLPENVLDLYVEFRNHTNGKELSNGKGLLGALSYFGEDSMDAMKKDAMRDLALRGGPWSKEEKKALLTYCESDVLALERIFPRMMSFIDFPLAVLRGRYMKAVSKIERNGIPIDIKSLNIISKNWDQIQDRLIDIFDPKREIFEGRSFSSKKFTKYLTCLGIPWPRLKTGILALDDDTFKDMGRLHPEVTLIRELRSSLSKMRLSSLEVGTDECNRCMLSPFSSKTGRNQPSNSRFIFGPSVWIRHLIQPKPGFGLAYIDWSQQEFGIAAALSKDSKMMDAYNSGDPYLAFAKQAGAVPNEATKETHGNVRDQFKACVLAVQYGMGEISLAYRIGKPVSHAANLLKMHRDTYRQFWKWSDSAVNYAMLNGKLKTTFGWQLYVNGDHNIRSLRNFPMQANGAEMLRLACCFGTEKEIKICAPIHDAVLIEAPIKKIDKSIEQMQACMRKASQFVLDGFSLRSDVKKILFPNHYCDDRGIHMWNIIWEILGQPERCIGARAPVQQRTTVNSI